MQLLRPSYSGTNDTTDGGVCSGYFLQQRAAGAAQMMPCYTSRYYGCCTFVIKLAHNSSIATITAAGGTASTSTDATTTITDDSIHEWPETTNAAEWSDAKWRWTSIFTRRARAYTKWHPRFDEFPHVRSTTQWNTRNPSRPSSSGVNTSTATARFPANASEPESRGPWSSATWSK